MNTMKMNHKQNFTTTFVWFVGYVFMSFFALIFLWLTALILSNKRQFWSIELVALTPIIIIDLCWSILFNSIFSFSFFVHVSLYSLEFLTFDDKLVSRNESLLAFHQIASSIKNNFMDNFWNQIRSIIEQMQHTHIIQHIAILIAFEMDFFYSRSLRS